MFDCKDKSIIQRYLDNHEKCTVCGTPLVDLTVQLSFTKKAKEVTAVPCDCIITKYIYELGGQDVKSK